MRHQLCLVSQQATPNVTPVLDAGMKPQRLTLLVSPDMQAQAKALQQALEPGGVQVQQWPIDDAWSVEHIRQRVLDFAETHADESPILNATGGTKPMSMAAYAVFRERDWPVFYVHPEEDRVIWLHPESRPSKPLEDRIRLEPFLLAHGVRCERLDRSPAASVWQQQAAKLARQSQHLISALNGLAISAEPSLQAAMTEKQARWSALQGLLEQLDAAGILQLQQHHVQFISEEARFFACGGWLEDYAFLCLQKLRSRFPHAIHDAARNVQVQRGEGVSNEIDVAFLCNNQLHIIECKSGQISKKATDMLYKLDSLRQPLGGIRTRAMFISVRTPGQADEKRASESRTQLCCGKQLSALEVTLADWLKLA